MMAEQWISVPGCWAYSSLVLHDISLRRRWQHGIQPRQQFFCAGPGRFVVELMVLVGRAQTEFAVFQGQHPVGAIDDVPGLPTVDPQVEYFALVGGQRQIAEPGIEAQSGAVAENQALRVQPGRSYPAASQVDLFVGEVQRAQGTGFLQPGCVRRRAATAGRHNRFAAG